jgi:[ribosomal protein S18]-alanine N-acetyltransferase
MIDLGQYSTARQALDTDRYQLKRLLGRKSIIHRHLDWNSPEAWLGKQPFFVLEDNDGSLLAALACPGDEAGLIWLRLFAVLPGFSINRAWKRLWSPVKDWLMEHQPGSEVNSLALRPEMKRILRGNKFKEISQVVSLYWEVASARWPNTRNDLRVREMTPEDLPDVQRIDHSAFQPLWQNSPTQLSAAFTEAFYATVVEENEAVQGYQISTTNPQGGHLARLAVHPGAQGQGLGIKILEDVLEHLSQIGIVEVSVNTQQDNLNSLELYKKFGFEQVDEIYPVLRYSI